MDPLIQGNAKSLTITKTVGNKELYNITIQNGDFATVRDQINAINNDPTIKSNRERSDKAWDVLERNGTKSPCPK